MQTSASSSHISWDILSEKAGFRAMLVGWKASGENPSSVQVRDSLCTCCGFWRSALYTRVHQMAILYIGMQTTYDLPGLWAGRDHLEMWQSGWSRCCFWLVYQVLSYLSLKEERACWSGQRNVINNSFSTHQPRNASGGETERTKHVSYDCLLGLYTNFSLMLTRFFL